MGVMTTAAFKCLYIALDVFPLRTTDIIAADRQALQPHHRASVCVCFADADEVQRTLADMRS